MTGECIARLTSIGIDYHDAVALRRIAMTLHSWGEAECGTDNGAIERDEVTNKPYWTTEGNAPTWKRHRYATPDREAGALKRLGKIMASYPTLSSYHQGDPRGASLYILRPGDVPEGKDAGAYYSRGVAVYK